MSTPLRSALPPHVAVIGGGPAGLMACETLLAAGARVDLYDTMPSVGRKFLLAGKGGLNLTHSEPAATFRARYAERQPEVSTWLDQLDADGLRHWAGELGISTFVGSSGKVFPAEMKAAPLLRAWLHRLRVAGLTLHMRHRWNGAVVPVTEPGTGRWQLTFDAPAGPQTTTVDAVVLALGGASWARLGSDGAWQPWLAGQGVDVRPLVPSNCGFDIAWSEHLKGKQAGAPLKGVRLTFTDRLGHHFSRLGEAVVSANGIEGNLVYAASALLRDEIVANGHADLHLDLLPAKDLPTLTTALAKGRGARSMPNHLKEQAGLTGVKAALLREGLDAAQWTALCADPAALAGRIKALPLRLTAPRPIDEAISSAGGVRLEAMDAGLMLSALPGVFCAGEMLDWEAPTGGYLLTACFASGRVAGQGALDWWSATRAATPAQADSSL